MTAGEYYASAAVDGRAVLVSQKPRRFREIPDPALWLCRVQSKTGQTLVAVDAEGPDEDDIDLGFMQAIDPATPIVDVFDLWHRHRASIPRDMRDLELFPES